METAKLFKNGQNQAVRLPKEYSFDGEEVYLKKVSNTVILIPKKNSWASLIDSLDEFSDDFMDEREQHD